MKVLARVLVPGRIAAADMAALEAEPQVNPGIVHFQALFAAVAAWFHFLDVLLMSTSLSHRSPHDFLEAANASLYDRISGKRRSIWRSHPVSTLSLLRRIQKLLKQLDDG
jgi:hypothetical protein